MLKLEKVYKSFQSGTYNEKKALNNINLTLEKGDFVTVIGGNGAGKSTLLNIITGTLTADTGKVFLNGDDISILNEHKRAKFISRLFQNPIAGSIEEMSILENMALAKRRGKIRGFSLGITKRETLEYINLLKLLGLGLENRINDKIKFLSGGERQAITLLMAVLTTPNLLLLDEHTASLDPRTSEKVMDITNQLILRSNITTIMVTHNMNDAIKYGNRLIMMDEGKIIYDIKNPEKSKLTILDLLKKFEEINGLELANDKMILIK